MADINRQSLQVGAELESLFGEAAKLANQTADLETKAGDAAALVSRTAGLAALETQQRTLDAATALGTNPADAAYMLTQLANDVNARYAERENAILQTQQASQVNIFTDGPLAWLGAQVDLPALNQAQEVAEARYNNAKDHYVTLNNLTQEAAQTMASIAQTKTTASVEAEAQALASLAQAKANQARIQGIQLNANGIKEAQNMRQQVFDNNLRMKAEARAEEQLNLARENARRIKEEQNKAQRDVTTYLNAVNVYRQSVGLQPLDEQMLRLKSNTQQGKLELDNQFELGLVSAQTGKQILGADPFAALSTINTPGVKVSPGSAGVADTVKQIVETGLRGQDVKARDLPNFVNGLVKAEADKMLANVSSGKSNVYTPPPLPVLADSEVTGLPFVQKVVASQIDAGVQDFQPDKLLHQGLALVKKGELSLSDVVTGVTALARKAVAYNNGYKNYEGLGLPRQKSLNMPVETTGKFRNFFNEAYQGRQDSLSILDRNNPLDPSWLLRGKSSSVIDITDDTAVNAYANKILAGEVASGILQRTPKLPKKTEQ